MRLAIMCRPCLSCIHPVSALMVTTDLLALRERGFRRGKKTTHGRSSKKPTVGRRCDLPWVGKTTYSRFFRGLWMTPLETACGAGLRGVGEDAVLCLSEGECKPCLFGGG